VVYDDGPNCPCISPVTLPHMADMAVGIDVLGVARARTTVKNERIGTKRRAR